MRVHRVIAVVLLLSCNAHHDHAPPVEPAGLELVSPGLPPLAPLRYALAKGATATLALDVDSKIIAGDQSNAAPPLHVALDIAVDDVLPDGRMKLTSTIRSMSATGDDPTSAHVDAIGSDLGGLAITATLSPDGTIGDVHATDQPLPDLAKAELAQLIGGFQQLAMPLPVVPIGVGAKWRTSRPVGPAVALALQTTTTVEVTGHTGSTLTYAIVSELHGADQTAVQDGVSVDVKSITGMANATGTIDLARFAVDTTQSAELHMEMTTGSDRTPMTMTQTLRVSSH